MEEKGFIHLYYGYGKGKTTAAMGLALRMLGYGKRVAVVQFLKNRPSGEIMELEQHPNVRILRGQAGNSFTITMTDAEKDATREIHNQNLKQVVDTLEQYDLVVLDEALDAYQLGLLDAELFHWIVEHKPHPLELVITGHKPELWVENLSDYVTEMRKVKHPYDSGVPARKGIEF